MWKEAFHLQEEIPWTLSPLCMNRCHTGPDKNQQTTSTRLWPLFRGQWGGKGLSIQWNALTSNTQVLVRVWADCLFRSTSEPLDVHALSLNPSLDDTFFPFLGVWILKRNFRLWNQVKRCPFLWWMHYSLSKGRPIPCMIGKRKPWITGLDQTVIYLSLWVPQTHTVYLFINTFLTFRPWV